MEWCEKFAAKETLKGQLTADLAETETVKAEITTLKGQLVAAKAETETVKTTLTRKSQAEFNKFQSVFQTFIREIEKDVGDL